MQPKLYHTLALLLLAHSLLYAQIDSLTFKNGDAIVGEIKEMEKGVLTMETDYSDSDFKIDWEEIERIYSESLLLIMTTDGRRQYGTLSTDPSGILILTPVEGKRKMQVARDQVFSIKSIDRGFLDRLTASIDLGYSLTKARNQTQFSFRSHLGYMTERWSFDISYNQLRSSQDETENIKRSDGNLSVRYVLPREWFLLLQNDFLSNTEQLLDLRSNTKFGVGKYLVRTNRWFWGLQTGISFNNEDFQGENNDRQSAESWVGTGINLYNVEDFSLITNLTVYPSLTENNRVRVDYAIDVAYDLPLDFYIKTGFTLNFDNQPVEGAARIDYVWQNSIGWSW